MPRPQTPLDQTAVRLINREAFFRELDIQINTSVPLSSPAPPSNNSRLKVIQSNLCSRTPPEGGHHVRSYIQTVHF